MQVAPGRERRLIAMRLHPRPLSRRERGDALVALPNYFGLAAKRSESGRPPERRNAIRSRISSADSVLRRPAGIIETFEGYCFSISSRGMRSSALGSSMLV